MPCEIPWIIQNSDWRHDRGFCEQFVCHNPAKLPTPAPWVTIKRIRVKDAYTHVWWMSPTETPQADRYAVGDCLHGIPWHICPTVALHDEVVVVRNQRGGERWKVAARGRSLSI